MWLILEKLKGCVDPTSRESLVMDQISLTTRVDCKLLFSCRANTDISFPLRPLSSITALTSTTSSTNTGISNSSQESFIKIGILSVSMLLRYSLHYTLNTRIHNTLRAKTSSSSSTSKLAKNTFREPTITTASTAVDEAKVAFNLRTSRKIPEPIRFDNWPSRQKQQGSALGTHRRAQPAGTGERKVLRSAY